MRECDECGEHHSRIVDCRLPEEILTETALSAEQAEAWRRSEAERRQAAFDRLYDFMRGKSA